MNTQERKSIVQRVVDWNELRFKQEFNYGLELSMLAEEAMELYEASNTVEKLDAVGDIVFVAIGTFWKLGMSVEHIESLICGDGCDLSSEDLPNLIGWGNICKSDALLGLSNAHPTSWSGFSLATDMVLITAVGSLRGLGYQEYFYDIVEAICDSNDTKVVKKTASDQKANIDKGQTFVPPTKRLVEIVNKVILDKHKEGVSN